MKIKRAVALCVDSGYLQLYDREDGQWLGNRHALYRLDGVPRMALEQLLALHDLTGKKLEKLRVGQGPAPETLDFTDAHQGDETIQQMGMQLKLDGATVQPLTLPEGLAWYDVRFMEPLGGPMEFCRVVVRRKPEGTPYFCVMDGLNLSAIIMPGLFGDSGIRAVRALCDAERSLGFLGRKTKTYCDPETGEVREAAANA